MTPQLSTVKNFQLGHDGLFSIRDRRCTRRCDGQDCFAVEYQVGGSERLLDFFFRMSPGADPSPSEFAAEGTLLVRWGAIGTPKKVVAVQEGDWVVWDGDSFCVVEGRRFSDYFDLAGYYTAEPHGRGDGRGDGNFRHVLEITHPRGRGRRGRAKSCYAS